MIYAEWPSNMTIRPRPLDPKLPPMDPSSWPVSTRYALIDILRTYLYSAREPLSYLPPLYPEELTEAELATRRRNPGQWFTDQSVTNPDSALFNNCRTRTRNWFASCYYALKGYRVLLNDGNPLSFSLAIKLLLGRDPVLTAAWNSSHVEFARSTLVALSRILFRFLRRAAFIMKKRRRCAYRVLFQRVALRCLIPMSLDAPDDMLRNVLQMLV